MEIANVINNHSHRSLTVDPFDELGLKGDKAQLVLKVKVWQSEEKPGVADVVAVFPHESGQEFPKTEVETESIRRNVTSIHNEHSVSLWIDFRTDMVVAPKVGDTIEFMGDVAFPKDSLSERTQPRVGEINEVQRCIDVAKFRPRTKSGLDFMQVAHEGKQLQIGKPEEERAVVIITRPTIHLRGAAEGALKSGIGKVLHVEPPSPYQKSKVTAWVEEKHLELGFAEAASDMSFASVFETKQLGWFDEKNIPLPKQGQFVAYEGPVATPVKNWRTLYQYHNSQYELVHEQFGRSYDLERFPTYTNRLQLVIEQTRNEKDSNIGTVVAVYPHGHPRAQDSVSDALSHNLDAVGSEFHAVLWVDGESSPAIGDSVDFDYELQVAVGKGRLEKFRELVRPYEKSLEKIQQRAERPRLAVTKQLEQPEQELDRERDRGIGR